MAIMLRRRQVAGFLVFLLLMVAAVYFVARHWADLGRPAVSAATLLGAGARVVATTTTPSLAALVGQARSAPAGSGYFASARLRQAQAESRQRASLRQLADAAHASATVRAEAEQELLALERRQAEETTAELVLQAKGYSPSLVLLSPGAATVVVEAAHFDAAAAARVGQAVAQAAGLDPAQVQIVVRPAPVAVG